MELLKGLVLGMFSVINHHFYDWMLKTVESIIGGLKIGRSGGDLWCVYNSLVGITGVFRRVSYRQIGWGVQR